MVGIYSTETGWPFTGKVAHSEAEAIWWIYKEVKKEALTLPHRDYMKKMNIVTWCRYYVEKNSNWRGWTKAWDYYINKIEVV